jgi:hypothetical protein
MLKNLDVIIKKNLIWIIIIIAVIVWLKFDLTSSPIYPIENANITKSLLSFSNDNFSFVYDKYSSVLPAYFLSLGTMFNAEIGGKIISLIFSLVQLFLFYLFCKELLKNSNYAFFATLFFALQAPIIFLGRIAGSDIIAITFFTLFLWYFTKMYNENFVFNITKIIILSLLFLLSLTSNYLIIFFLPLAFVLAIKENRKSAIIFISVVVLMTTLLIILFSDYFFTQLSVLFTIDDLKPLLVSKLVVRIAEYIAIPIMIIFAASQILWKTNIKPTMIMMLVISSFIIPIYIFIFNDMHNIYRLIGFSLVLLIPFSGIVIFNFLKMDMNYRISTIILLFFALAVSYWNITKLESAYFDTNVLTKYFETQEIKKMNFYSEDPFLVSSNFYPVIKEANNLNLTLLRKKGISSGQRENIIRNKIKNGELDFIILNGLIHPELTEKIKSKNLAAYKLVFSKDIQVNTMMYPVSESVFEIYKVRDEFKIYRQFYAKKD